MIIGLNNGGFYRLEYDRLSDQVINEIINNEVTAIEFVCYDIKMLDDLLIFDLPDNSFKFISLHTPSSEYKDNSKTRNILNKVSAINERFNLNNVIIHSDEIKDLAVFDSFNNLPFSIENSNNMKKFGRTAYDIKSILDNSILNLTLDVQHCYVNDPTMFLANNFYKEFKDKIVEFHISGYDKEFNHYPLFKTKQNIIIDFIKDKDVPIILESTYDSLAEAKIEINYIKNNL